MLGEWLRERVKLTASRIKRCQDDYSYMRVTASAIPLTDRPLNLPVVDPAASTTAEGHPRDSSRNFIAALL